MLTVSEVRLKFIKPQNGLIAFASFVLGESLYVSRVGVYAKLDGSGYRLTYPTAKAGYVQESIFHPINRQTAQKIEEAVFAKLNDVMEKSYARHCDFNDGTPSL